MHDLQKAIDLIEKNEHIALLLPQEPTLDCLVSAEVLARTLTSLGKHIGFLTPHLTDTSPQKDHLPHMASASPLAKEFIISLDTSRAPIGQLRYEKNESQQ